MLLCDVARRDGGGPSLRIYEYARLDLFLICFLFSKHIRVYIYNFYHFPSFPI